MTASTTPRSSNVRSHIAVVGAGVSGLTAAYLLSRDHDVTLYEADQRLGGHAHTHSITGAAGDRLAVDSGFIVHNDRTYPYLRRLFAELGIETRATEMSMSIRDDASGFEYAGGRGLKGILAQPRGALSPSFGSVLLQVKRFHRRANAFLDSSTDLDQTTYGEFLDAGGFSEQFRRLYALPLVACVWSMGTGDALDYPAHYLFRFLSHHGMLTVTDSPQWRTVTGGSHVYVDAVAARIGEVRAGRGVVSVLRNDDGVTIEDTSGAHTRFDKVVLAAHADQSLALLADASPTEKDVLGAFRYSRSETVLHTDASLLPQARQARASWNYLTPADAGPDAPPVVTYWMNRLQGLTTAEQYLVTLNARERIDPDRVIAVMDYEHPLYDLASIRAQHRLGELTTSTTTFAGAYHGWGFHEDGCRSGVEAARAFGVEW